MLPVSSLRTPPKPTSPELPLEAPSMLYFRKPSARDARIPPSCLSCLLSYLALEEIAPASLTAGGFSTLQLREDFWGYS